MKTVVNFLFVFILIPALTLAQKFNRAEKELILAGDTTTMMRIIQVNEAEELKVLQTVATDISHKDKLLPILAKRMYLAMTDPKRPGVGIAAPQVGISRNLVWVQRLDKDGEPFELYLNPKIVWQSKLLRKGLEGCLSIPDIIDNVMRNYIIQLSYRNVKGNAHTEFIEGFTAVIFQHETDHLKGILFTDRLREQQNGEYHLINNETNLYLEKLLKRQ